MLRSCQSASGIAIGMGVTQLNESWTVPNNAPCEGAVRSITQSWSTVNLHSIRVAKRASHGTAGVYGNFQFAYSPVPGFVGKDEFELGAVYGPEDRYGNNSGLTIEATIAVNVDVVRGQ